MKTVNISLTEEQAQFVDKTTKSFGFANRSEFLRAVLRFVRKSNPELLKEVSTAPFPATGKSILTLEEIKKRAIPILKKNDVEFAGIFGSYARGEAGPDSDVDLIVRFGKSANEKSLLDIIHLENELTDAFGTKTDLATEDELHPMIKPQVEKDLVPIYGKR